MNEDNYTQQNNEKCIKPEAYNKPELAGEIKPLNRIEDIENLFDCLFPICRSILGEGYRKSLSILSQYIPLETISFPTGMKVLNWIIPREWVIKDGWIKDEAGNKIIDIKDNNLHVLNYSTDIDETMELEQLKEYIHTVPSVPDAIPYAFSYYKKRWGFCMSENQKKALPDGRYHAYINSWFRDGQLLVGQTVLEGKRQQEILISSYLCHPSMANNELSGPIVLAILYQKLLQWKSRRFTYRFVANPETIGSISFLSRYGNYLKKNLYGGLVLTCLGGENTLRYKKSRREDSWLDRLIEHLNGKDDFSFRIIPFSPLKGSDERQYCSAGFNLPVGQMARLVYGEYKEYHTSLDTKELMGIENIMDSADKLERLLKANELEGFYINRYPYGEIKLSEYQLYPTLNDKKKRDGSDNITNDREFLNQILMILNYSDGYHLLSWIGERLGRGLTELEAAVALLKEKGLLKGPFIKEELNFEDCFNVRLS